MPLLIGGSGPRMLRLAARHADIWNCVGGPEDAGAVNQRLDAACQAEGRDPSSLVRTISPRVNLLESAEAFADGVAAYRAAGFRDIYLPWPRTERELPVLREVAREVIPGLRGEARASAVPFPEDHLIADLTTIDAATISRAYAAIRGGVPRRLLDLLIDHPDERFDAAALRERLALERHDDIARGFAALAADLATHGIARFWTEGQAGYLLAGEQAAALTRGIGGKGESKTARRQVGKSASRQERADSR